MGTLSPHLPLGNLSSLLYPSPTMCAPSYFLSSSNLPYPFQLFILTSTSVIRLFVTFLLSPVILCLHKISASSILHQLDLMQH